jgi:hypothetical protein
MTGGRARDATRRSRLATVVVLLTAAFASGCGSLHSSREPMMEVSRGNSHSVVAPLEGTNLDYSGVAEPYDETSVRNAVTSLALGTIRYPGGTIANYWDWQTGSVNQPPATTKTVTGEIRTFPGRHRTYDFTLGTLRRLTSATGAIPIFDLNVMTSTLGDQLQMLETAARMGIPVRYIELGNELYLSNSNYLRAFPTAASYAHLVASWAPAIRRAFPNVQIAAVASASIYTAREQHWNSALLSIAGNDINAVTVHEYPGAPPSGSRPPSPKALLAGVTKEWEFVDETINALPLKLSVWLTEYNLNPGDLALGSPALGSTWEHGLYVAELDLLELEAKRVALSDYWDLFGTTPDAQFATSMPPVITPVGSASQLINEAVKGATNITSLSITHDPGREQAIQSVNGIEVTLATGGTRVILVNLGSQPFTLPAGGVIRRGASIKRLAASLTAQSVEVWSSHIMTKLVLPSYSVTVVG